MNRERLAAACRMLQDSGDMTPMATRILTQINEAEEAKGVTEGE